MPGLRWRADIDHDAYSRSIGVVRRRQALDSVALAKRHGASGHWLDVGCGFGYLLEVTNAAGFRVGGVEPDPKAVREARARVGDVVREGVLTDLTESAHVLSMLDVLEHIPRAELASFARAVHRTLEPNGLWIIKVPSTEGLFFRIAHALHLRPAIRRLWQSDYESPHTVYFDRRTLSAFLRRHGFEAVAHHYLADVPSGTALARLRFDPTTARWLALLSVPAIYVVNFIERLRRKSDALLVIARVTPTPPCTRA